MKSLERTARKVRKGHYVASPHHNHNGSSPPYVSTNRAYFSDGDESRAPSERTLSEYTMANERTTTPPQAPARKSRDKSRNGSSSNNGVVYADGPRSLSSPPPTRPPPRAGSALSYDNGGENGDIYVTSAAYKTPSEISRYSMPHRTYNMHKPRSVYSVASSRRTGKSQSSRRMGAKIETMSAPNPFCPTNLRGVCCLMLLINLGLILVTLGFVIVIQFVEPLFVW